MSYEKGIDALLDLDGIIIEQAGGYWTKFEVRKLIDPTKERPHGLRYSLTLHDRHGNRVLGFDNAHAVKSGKYGKYRTRKTYDHRHRHAKDEGVFYEFVNAFNYSKIFGMKLIKR